MGRQDGGDGEAVVEVPTRLVPGDPDRTAFEDWYRVAWPRVVRAVAVFTCDVERAADASAEAFTRAWQRWDGPSRPADPTTWTIVVAINQAKRNGRRDARWRPERSWDGRRSVGLGDSDLDLWRAVAQLPPRARMAVALRYGSDLTERGVAEAMGVSVGTAAATLHTARRTLREHLARGGDDG